MSAGTGVGNEPASSSAGGVFLELRLRGRGSCGQIADALRAAGIEVWFDRSELRGGDLWDQSIRQQIRECRLFVPVISRHTDSRREGYFRREWKLAVDRTHDMSEQLGEGHLALAAALEEAPDFRRAGDEFDRRWRWLREARGCCNIAGSSQ